MDADAIDPESGLDGRVALVTGASSGIGQAACLALAAWGAAVAAVGRDKGRLRTTLDGISKANPAGPAPLGLTLDVRDEADMKIMLDETLERFGRVDVLVACAGTSKTRGAARLVPHPAAKLPAADWDEILDTNLKGTFLSNRAVLPHMIARRRGEILNISSSPGGVRGQAFAPAYCASKFAVTALSQSIAEEAAPYGVRVQVLFPDAIDTPLLHSSTLPEKLGRPLPPSRVADLIVYMLTLPQDTRLISPLIAPHARRPFA